MNHEHLNWNVMLPAVLNQYSRHVAFFSRKLLSIHAAFFLTCNECKSRSYYPSNLIKATQPMEQLNLNFKTFLPSNSNKKYILTVVDEHSCFPFTIPCQDAAAVSVYKALCQIFFRF